ncbi:TPA: Glycoprotein [Anole lyssa-like virus 1]|uniref:Glycoprotein n=1 Tax=Anole lyssa-like virus 1 TaxID=2772344 RepID=A0AAD3AVP4_9RHAB|nr:Glycoprotein [Anole lyssa-like virus 1]FAA01391.1 TPA: Glycoprotein [Anole lyssa-like virus 1]
MRACLKTLVLLASVNILFSYDPPLYTIPSHISPWRKINPNGIRCPSDVYLPDDNCSTEREITYTELGLSSNLKNRIDGYTCTGIRYSATTYTNFVGYVTTSFSQDFISPSLIRCKESYIWKFHGDPRYEESLNHPYPDYSWLRTITTQKDSYIVTEHSDVEIDLYTSDFISSLFPGGACKRNVNQEGYCPSIHEKTIWIPEGRSLNAACDIFMKSKGKILSKDGNLCGFIDKFSNFRSLENSCKISICGKKGLHLYDGMWVSFKDEVITGECPASTLVNQHTRDLDEVEYTIHRSLLDRRERCLDALEDLMLTYQISFRRLSLFRKAVPGRGKVFSLLNGSLVEADATYLPVKAWRDILSTPDCLIVDGSCYPPSEKVLFNGIFVNDAGHVIIPERVFGDTPDQLPLIESYQIPMKHPHVDMMDIKNSVESHITESITSDMMKGIKRVSDIQLGLPDWGRYLLYTLFGLGTLFFIWVILKCCCNKKKTKDKTMRIEKERSNLRNANQSWEDYKSGKSELLPKSLL